MFHRSLIGAALLLVSGCATQSPSAINPKQTLAGKTHWQAEGKIALAAKTYQTNASFDWQQSGANYRIRFFGPFGLGAAWLIKDGKSVSFEDQEHGKKVASSPEELMNKAMGWQVPITELQHWIKGVPAPGSPVTATSQDEQGNLASLDQLGWHIVYSNYQAQDGWVLPGKLIATREAVKVVMVNKAWRLDGL